MRENEHVEGRLTCLRDANLCEATWGLLELKPPVHVGKSICVQARKNLTFGSLLFYNSLTMQPVCHYLYYLADSRSNEWPFVSSSGKQQNSSAGKGCSLYSVKLKIFSIKRINTSSMKHSSHAYHSILC